MTVSGVGYGDEYPVTSGGRLVGIVLMTAGIGIYATLGGYFARRLIRRRAERDLPASELGKDDLSKEDDLSEIRKRMQDLEKNDEETLDRLKRNEALLSDSKDSEKKAR